MYSQTMVDRIGMCASSFCAVHCLLMPFVLGILPMLSLSFLATNQFEWIMISIAGVIGSMGVITGFRVHTKYTAILLFAFGIFILVTNRVVHASATGAPCCDLHTLPEETNNFPILLSVIGGGLVASSHVVNQYYCKQCSSCNRASCNLD